MCRRKSYRKHIGRAYLTVANFFKIRLIKLINRDTDKNCSKSFSDSNDSSDIAEEIIKQISKLRPFDMEPRKTVPKKPSVSGEENNCEEEINLAPQDGNGNIDRCKCGCECKPTVTFAVSFCCRDSKEIPDGSFKDM